MGEQALTALIVDDDECDRIAMRRALTKALPGVEIHDAGSQQAALALLMEHTFSCAFLDYRLPDGDGLTLLRTALSQGVATPMVMLTGCGDEALAVEALQVGAADYLSKSQLTSERLLQCIDRVIARSDGSVWAGTGREGSLRHLGRAVDNAAESMMITDPNGRIEYVNPAFTELTGYEKTEVIGQTPRLLRSEETPQETHAGLWQTISAGGVWRGELTNRRKDGSSFETAVTISPVLGDRQRIEGFVATHRDISKEKGIAARMEHLANTDGLTGLDNRRHLMERMEQELARARRYSRPLCLMLVDLDYFKQVNDRFGHLVGDKVLAGSAQVIREVSRASDLVGRYGGEEFAVVLPETDIEKAESLAERLCRRLTLRRYYPQSTEGDALSVTCSVGLAQFRGGDADSLLAAADEALYAAKAAGRNRVEVAGGPSDCVLGEQGGAKMDFRDSATHSGSTP